LCASKTFHKNRKNIVKSEKSCRNIIGFCDLSGTGKDALDLLPPFASGISAGFAKDNFAGQNGRFALRKE
jgi:hypothetical protein